MVLFAYARPFLKGLNVQIATRIQTDPHFFFSYMEGWIGIGSNLGDSRLLCSEAIARLHSLFPMQFAASSLYRTSPVGEGFDGDFINAVCRIRTDMTPYELLATLQMVEYGLGKEAKVRGRGNRMMDLDLLLYGDLILQEETLQIPHPGWWDRLFVLIPMHEVTPCLLWRGEQIYLNKRIAELKRNMYNLDF